VLTLYVLQGPDKGRRFDLPTEEHVLLGRASELVPISDLTVSRRHARLQNTSDGWVIYNEGASNGLFLNGVRVERTAKVKVGDQIRLGSTLLVFGSPRQNVTVSEDALTPTGHVAKAGDSAIISTASAADSVVLAAPEPSQAAMAHFQVLLQIANTISSSLDTDDLLNKVMDHIFEQIRADRGFLGFVDEDNKVIPRVVRYRDEDQVGKIAVSQTIISHVVSRGEGVLSSNAMADVRFSKGKSVHNLLIRSAICVPIKGRDKLLGVIHVDSSVANYTYTNDQLRLLTAIGLQTGVAIENLRLYQESVQSERLAAAGETVASLSHSIKNILQGISGGGDVLEMSLRKADVEQARLGWQMLKRNIDKVQQLTLNMLAFSKSRKPTLELTHLPHVLNECVELVKVSAREKNVELRVEIKANQPPIPCDADGIHQAILNLLGNAIDACDAHRGAPGGGVGGIVRIVSDYDKKAEEATIEVHDNGVGIDKADLENIFEPFWSTKGQRGTGLGLAVTKKIIDEHAGSIAVESTVGKGTIFRIGLPMNRKVVISLGDTVGPK
jgi:two-component system, NtrC family, sensor kinase